MVRLPLVIAGVSNPAAVIKLQNEMGELRSRAAKLEESLGGEKASNKLLKWEINNTKWREEMTKIASEERATEA